MRNVGDKLPLLNGYRSALFVAPCHNDNVGPWVSNDNVGPSYKSNLCSILSERVMIVNYAEMKAWSEILIYRALCY